MRRLVQKATRLTIFAVLRALAFGARYLSWQWGVRLGKGFGQLCFYLLPAMRRRSLTHLERAFGTTPALKGLAKHNFRHLGQLLFETLMLSYLPSTALASLVEIEGEGYLKEAVARGSGVILITGHIGNWEMMGAALAAAGYPMNVIGATLYDSRLNAWLLALRGRFHIKTIVRGSLSASKEILTALRSGGILAFLIDQDTRAKGVFVNFFGEPAHTPVGAAALALRSGASALCAFITRLPNNQHRVTFKKPFLITPTKDATADIRRYTERFTADIEQQIRLAPEQWVWIHRRWNRKPNVTLQGVPC